MKNARRLSVVELAEALNSAAQELQAKLNGAETVDDQEARLKTTADNPTRRRFK
jgi:hypothetical protein